MLTNFFAGEIAVSFPLYILTSTKGLRAAHEKHYWWFSSNVTYEQSFILKNLYEVNASLMTTDKEMFVKSTLVQTYLKKLWGK